MIEDANFVGDRLRLAAFLRVVDSDMLRRPARLRRRVPLINQVSSTPQTSGSQSDPDAQFASAPQETGNGPGDEEDGAVANFDMLHSPNASEEEPDTQDKITAERHNGQHSPSKNGMHNKHLKQDARVSKAKASRTKLRKSPATRNTRLPVPGLALLRTTTSEGGLPEPGDAHRAFAAAIEEFDPIDDSQMGLLHVENAHIPSRSVLALQMHQDSTPDHRRDYHSGQPLALKADSNINLEHQSSDSYSVKKSENPLLGIAPLPEMVKIRQYCRTRASFVADGFEASELFVSPSKKTLIRHKAAPRQKKSQCVLPRLTLVDGKHSIPEDLMAHAFLTLENTITSSELGRSYTVG
ncbi:hypothetical protein ACEQ8H_006456 [Pleosporales sp. CAS-2024a]